VAPALAAGCTVVLKPAGLAPISAFILAEIMESAGLPAGVFNLVSGKGNEVGDSLVSHPKVGIVSFTGSVETGRHVAALAGKNLKKVSLELGGKSASIVFDRTSLLAAVAATVGSCFLNSGQTCSALTRLLVPEDLYEEAVSFARTEGKKYVLGNPLDKASTLGPLASPTQKTKVISFIKKGKEQGAELIIGGDETHVELKGGNFVLPTIFGRVKHDSTLAQEEIFGPVLSIITFKSEEEAIAIANGTCFGLNAAVWATDREQAMRVAGKMESGQVQVNGPSYNPDAPFGGYKYSGFGRELGPYAIEEYLRIKAILVD
jgi:betaine-aldehyde dehydrogenase